MIKEALDFIIKESKKGEVVKVGDKIYLQGNGYTEIRRKKIERLEVTTLDALIEYIEMQEPAVEIGFIHVETPKKVYLYSYADTDNQRELYIAAEPIIPQFEFEKWRNVEDFNIMLLSKFKQTEDRDTILRLLSNVVTENGEEISDNGISQTVVAKTGIARLGSVEVPNPCELAPYRTFHEVEQPVSKFILRVRKGSEGPQAALFEGDGNLWQNEAIALIKKYLKEKLPQTQVI